MVRKWFEDMLDNRFVQKAIVLIALYNLLRSYRTSRKEWSIIKETINENDDFFNALATLGFVASPRTLSLVSVQPYSEEYTFEQVRKIASTTVIAVIMKYVKSENLLGIIHVDCDIKPNNMIVTTISPNTSSILAADIFDFLWSVSLTATCVSLFYAAKYFFF